MFEGHNLSPWRVIDDDNEVAVYDSIDSLWEDAAIKQTPAYVTGSSRQSRSTKPTKSWDLGVGFEKGYKLGTTEGWLEGAQTATRVRKQMKRLNARLEGSKVVRKDMVAGGTVNIGKFVGGAKKHMIRRKRIRTADGTHVTIGVENSALCYVESKEMVNRGCAISGLIQAIENMGISVELTQLHTSKSSVNYSNDTRYTVAAKVKRAGTYMNDERIAMALGHPATFRRGVFGIKERHPDFFEVFGDGYGRTKETSEVVRKALGVDYHIRSIHDDQTEWGDITEDQMVAWVESKFDEVMKSKNIRTR